MPRPRRTIRPTQLNVSIPETLRAEVDLKLYSEVERRVPHGAYSAYICRLIEEDLKGVSQALRERAQRAEDTASRLRWPDTSGQ